MNARGAVIFDMDGVLADTPSSWVSVHRFFSVDNTENLKRFIAGEIDEYEFMRSDVRLWRMKKKDISISDIARILSEVPVMAGAREAVSMLMDAGYRTALISGGIDILADRIVSETGIEIGIANGLQADQHGRLTGEGILRVSIRDKGRSVPEVARMLNVVPSRCIAVGDAPTDISMFHSCGMGIAFNADDELVVSSADFSVRERDLRTVAMLILREGEHD